MDWSSVAVRRQVASAGREGRSSV